MKASLRLARWPLACLMVQTALLLGATAQALPMMMDNGPSRAKVIVEDFSSFEVRSRWLPIVTANGTVDRLETFILEGESCGEGNKCLAPVEMDWDVVFRDLPERTLLWSTDFIQPVGSSFTTWTVTGGSGVSVFSNLAYQPHFAFFDPLGLISIQLHVDQGLDEYGERLIEYFRFDNITTVSVPEGGSPLAICLALIGALLSRRTFARRRIY